VPAGRQDSQHDGFVSRDVPYDCAQCIGASAKRHEFPELDPENYPAWRLYQQVEDQVRIGMDVVGLDYTVLPAVFAIYQIPPSEQPLLFEKLVVLNRLQQEQRARERAMESSRKAEAQSQKIADGR